MTKTPSLADAPLLFLDCQTTGMRPSSGSLLELGWSWRGGPVETRLLRLPEGESLPARVAEITGLTDDDLAGAFTAEDVHRDLMNGFPGGIRPLAVAHYASFEKAFLLDFFGKTAGREELPFELLCSQKIAKRLFPNLPSHNLRALGGFFGHPVEETNRAGSHVKATALIWNAIAAELATRNLATLDDLLEWMKDAPAKAARYEYHMDRLKRLALPRRPGIYRMLSKSGDVLYVGKATSLKDRVNSYFRGKKGRDPRKLEMLAQVWDLEVVECGSILEASLLENDEIKRLDPPYNVSLKAGQRQLLFYSRDYEDFAMEESAEHPIGPFRPFNHVEQLRRLQLALESGRFEGLFYSDIPEDRLRDGFRIFLQRENLEWELFLSLRSALAVGLKLFRRSALSEEEPEETEEAQTVEENEIPTAEEVAAKFERLFIRAGAENRRRRRLTRLLNCRVHFETDDGWRSLRFLRGRPADERAAQDEATTGLGAWTELRIDDYDRMSVLLSEIARVPHRLEDP